MAYHYHCDWLCSESGTSRITSDANSLEIIDGDNYSYGYTIMLLFSVLILSSFLLQDEAVQTAIDINAKIIKNECLRSFLFISFKLF